MLEKLFSVKLHMNRDTQRPSWPAQPGDSLVGKPARKAIPCHSGSTQILLQSSCDLSFMAGRGPVMLDTMR